MSENSNYILRLTPDDCREFKNIIRAKLFMQDIGKVERYKDHLLISFKLVGSERKIEFYFYDYMYISGGFSGLVQGKDVGELVTQTAYVTVVKENSLMSMN